MVFPNIACDANDEGIIPEMANAYSAFTLQTDQDGIGDTKAFRAIMTTPDALTRYILQPTGAAQK